jgi:hypothetical protein
LRKNPEEGFDICLNSLEIFGILREMSEEEKRLREQRFFDRQRIHDKGRFLQLRRKKEEDEENE